MHSTNIPHCTSQSSTSAIIWFPINPPSMNSTCVICSFDSPAICPNLWLAQQDSLLNNVVLQLLWRRVKDTLTLSLFCHVAPKQKIMELLQRLERNWKQFEITTTDCGACAGRDTRTKGHHYKVDRPSYNQSEKKFSISETSDAVQGLILQAIDESAFGISPLTFLFFLSFPMLSLINDHQSAKHLWKDFFF